VPGCNQFCDRRAPDVAVASPIRLGLNNADQHVSLTHKHLVDRLFKGQQPHSARLRRRILGLLHPK
jgi:hypothetical protein